MKSMTPLEFFNQEMRLSVEDYVSWMSFRAQPFYTQGEYKVDDNWWHSNTYYNVPLNEWYGAIVNAIRNGYTVALGGDVSEPGKGRWDDICIVPTFDIPREYIDQSSREFRFYDKTTADDHGIHLIGYQKIDIWDWFLIKDSGSSAYEGLYPGYYFFRGDFIQLKMLTFMVHKDAVEALLLKCKNGSK
jgi:bleomycin hydrolase